MNAVRDIEPAHPVPNIYFSFGMTKSGSTLGFELARTGLEQAGMEQELLPSCVSAMRRINFAQHLDNKAVVALEAITDAIGHPVAIKTHTRPDPEVIRLLQSGRASAHAIYRDPRDIALSMLDHGERAHTIEDTIEPIKHQTNSLLAWLSLPNVRPLYYDDLAFDTVRTMDVIANELGFAAPAETIKEVMTSRFTQLNVGVRDRHMLEMDKETSQRFETIFAPFYDRLIHNRAQLRRDGHPVLDPQAPLAIWT